jgi:hypothetical protein
MTKKETKQVLQTLSVDSLPTGEFIARICAELAEQQPEGFSSILSDRYQPYKLAEALAEFADNSLDANASQLSIEFEGEERAVINTIVFIDDGDGMNYDQLKECTRRGSTRSRLVTELGKFGKGCVFAAISLGKRFTFLTRDSGGVLLQRSVDLDVCEEKDGWYSIPIDPTAEMEKYFNDRVKGTGTIVILENLDRVRNPQASKMAQQIKTHFGEIYASYISFGDVQFTVDGTPVEARDPLCWDHPNCRQELDLTLSYEGEEIRVRLVDLTEVPTEEMKRKGLRAEHTQGLYFLRNERLILGAVTGRDSAVEGFWTGHPNYRFVRVTVEFASSLDDAFGIPIQKNNISLRKDLNDIIQTAIMPTVRAIGKRTSKAGQQKAANNREKALANATSAANNKFTKVKKKRKSKVHSNKKKVITLSRTDYSSPAGVTHRIKEVNYGASNKPFCADEPDIVINLDSPPTTKWWVDASEETRRCFSSVALSLTLAEMELGESSSERCQDHLTEFIDTFHRKLRTICKQS